MVWATAGTERAAWRARSSSRHRLLPGRHASPTPRHDDGPDSAAAADRAEGQAHGRVPARRHDDQRQPRRGPEPAERRASGSPDRPQRRRAAEATPTSTRTTRRRRAQPPQVRTDGAASPKGYAHKLGDIFHSEPLVRRPAALLPVPVGQPAQRQATRRSRALHTKRRKVLVRRRQRRLPARLRRRRLGSRNGELRRHAGTSARAARSSPTPRRRHHERATSRALLNSSRRAAVLRGRLHGQGGRLHRPGSPATPTRRQPRSGGRVIVGTACGRAAIRLRPRRDAAGQDRRDRQRRSARRAPKDNAPDCLERRRRRLPAVYRATILWELPTILW